MKKITAMIAVRKGSKRVPNKNIKKFADTSLLEIKIKQLSRMTGIDEIIVSTDCERMWDISNDYGVKAVMRDPALASDHIPMNEVYESLARLASYDHILYAHVTSPLLKDTSMNKCIIEYQALPDRFDSLATVKSLKEYMWNKDGPINYDPSHHPRSQDLPEIYALNFAVNMIPKDLMIEYRNIVGKRFHPVVLDSIESIDVDDQEDFEVSEMIYKEFYK